MKYRILILLLAVAGYVQAQQNNVQSAADWLKNYNDLPKAKSYIDLAAANPSTANDPKMWYYMGKIYWAIHRDTTHSVDDPDAALKAANGFLNCLSTDTKNFWHDECVNMAWVSGLALYNKGVEAYRKNDLERAEKFYTRLLDVFPVDKDNQLRRNNITPELVGQQLYQVAYKAKDYPKAKAHLQKLIDSKYNDPMIYFNMSRILLEEKDTAKALTYNSQGRTLFEDNTSLMNQEMNIYLSQHKLDVLIDKITAAISGDSENEVLYYKRGLLYENMGDRTKAEADYRKAVELRPDYFDANHALGTILFNQAAQLANAANDMKAADFDKAKAVFDAKFRESIPYLEKSIDLNPKKTEEDKKFYKAALTALKSAYARTGQNDKYEQVKALLDKS